MNSENRPSIEDFRLLLRRRPGRRRAEECAVVVGAAGAVAARRDDVRWSLTALRLGGRAAAPGPGTDRRSSGSNCDTEARSARSGRGGQQRQDRVPGQHEPRDPHADERHHRHDRAGARHRARRPSSASTCSMVTSVGRVAADDHQRHPRLLEDRGGQAGARADPVRAARRGRRRAEAAGAAAPSRRGSSWSVDVAPGRARRSSSATRSGCGRSSSTWSATRSSSPSSGEVVVAVREEARGDGCVTPALQRARHRHRHSRREAGAASSRRSAGRRLDDAQVRRHRARPGDLVAAGRADGRPDLGRERAGQRQHVPLHRRARHRPAAAPAPPRRPGAAARSCRCWSSTTTRRTAASSTSLLAAGACGRRPWAAARRRWPRSTAAARGGAPFPLVLLDATCRTSTASTSPSEIARRPELAGADDHDAQLVRTGADDAARCRALGIAAYLTKPIKQSELLDAICRTLGRHAGRHGAAPSEPAPPDPPALRRLRVLLAEDNVVNQTRRASACWTSAGTRVDGRRQRPRGGRRAGARRRSTWC